MLGRLGGLAFDVVTGPIRLALGSAVFSVVHVSRPRSQRAPRVLRVELWGSIRRAKRLSLTRHRHLKKLIVFSDACSGGHRRHAAPALTWNPRQRPPGFAEFGTARVPP